MFRKLAKIAMYIGLTLVVLACGVYLARDPLRDALIRTVASRLSQSMNGSLEINQLRGSLISSLILQDMVLRGPDDVIIRLDKLRLIYHP